MTRDRTAGGGGEAETAVAGVLCVDKPAGVTSFGVVARVRELLGVKKVGHAGTLDPFATGVLVICVGRPATKLISRFMDGEKEYLATVQLGVETETLDPEGEIIRRTAVGTISGDEIERVLARFCGEQFQKPPVYSAVKHRGKPLYWYARRGIAVDKPPRQVVISQLERVGDGDCTDSQSLLHLRVRCSKGTYIRVLGAEIAAALGCGGHLTALRRTFSGCFAVDGAVTGADLEAGDARSRLLVKMQKVEDIVKLLQ